MSVSFNVFKENENKNLCKLVSRFCAWKWKCKEFLISSKMFFFRLSLAELACMIIFHVLQNDKIKGTIFGNVTAFRV